MRLIQFIRQLHGEESGQDMLEYALVILAVSLAALAGSNSLATTLVTSLSLILSKIGNIIS